MSTSQNKDSLFLKLAFHQANINLGSTSSNPSVGCVVVKNNSVISSGRTSFNGRPHAEAIALKKNINFKGSNIYITLEPCSHYGRTPPCVKNIISKKLNKVIFSINDMDKRSRNLAYKQLEKANISVKKFILKKYAQKFYKSYFLQSLKQVPFVDAKLAISKDYLTINKKNKSQILCSLRNEKLKRRIIIYNRKNKLPLPARTIWTHYLLHVSLLFYHTQKQLATLLRELLMKLPLAARQY